LEENLHLLQLFLLLFPRGNAVKNRSPLFQYLLTFAIPLPEAGLSHHFTDFFEPFFSALEVKDNLLGLRVSASIL
jgi:hypothetical protein